MPHAGSFGLFLTLHILAAVFIVGPLGSATVAAPSLVRAGQPALPRLRTTLRATRRYPPATLLIALFGLVILREGSFGSVREITDGWILSSILLWLAAVTVTLGVIAPTLARAIAAIEAGQDTARLVPVVAVGSLVAVACWVGVIGLMVIKPGT